MVKVSQKRSPWENGAFQLGNGWGNGLQQILGGISNSVGASAKSWGNGLNQWFGQPKPAAPKPKPRPQPQPKPKASQQGRPQQAAPTLMDFLNQALGMVGQRGGGPAFNSSPYDNQISALQQQGQQGDRRLAEAYAGLVQRYAQDLPGIQQNYDQAGQQLQQTSDAATRDTNAGYGASEAAQNDILKNLGIGDAKGVIVGNGTFSGNQQAYQLGDINQLRAGEMGANTQRRATATNYNTQAGQAQAVQGAQQRALLQQNIAKQVAAAEAQRAQAQAAYQQQQYALQNSGISQALGLANNMNTDYLNRSSQASKADQAAADYALRAQSAQQKAASSQNAVAQVNQYIKQNGLHPDAATYARLIAAWPH